MFDIMDEDSSGQVNFEEFFHWWQERNERGDLEVHNEAAGVFSLVDADGDGRLVRTAACLTRQRAPLNLEDL